jgi:diguanylate cyclase (GGDEF)-like protein/PAS domain S-box-containing protein
MPGLEDREIYRSVLDSLQTGVYLVDRDGKIFFWNDGAERITGYLRQDVLGHSCSTDFLGHTDEGDNRLSGAAAPIATVIRDGKPADVQISLRHKSGHQVPVRLRAVPIRDSRGTVIGAAESFEESISVSDWNRRQTKLARFGCLDQTTGVLNHGMLESHVRESLAMFAEHPVPFCLLCIEVDHLDDIKARYGSGAVVLVLHEVAQTMENSLRPTDYLGRWTANKFLAILTECSSSEVAAIGERVRKMAGRSEIEWWGDALPVSVSMGATPVKPEDTVESIVQRAEQALRESIERGGNCLRVKNE